MKTIIGVADHESIAKRSLERARRLDRGEAVPAERRIMFSNAEDLAAFLVSPCRSVLQAAMQQPRSISEIAGVLKRTHQSVSRDVHALRELGLVRISGQHRSSVASDPKVRAVASKIDLRAQLCA